MPFMFKSVAQLEREVNRISNRVRARAFNEALSIFSLNGLTTMRMISEFAETFEYTPKVRNMIMGDVNPASCKSDPTTVDVASGDTMKGFTVLHEIGYEICLMDCKDDLEQIVYEKELAAATMLLNHLYNKFWFGNPELMQYGLTNHPLTQIVEASAGTNGTKWSQKTNNEIMKEIRACIKYMANPRILVSEQAFEDSLGNADESGLGMNACSIRADCVQELLGRQETVNFDGNIRFMEELDNRAEFGGENIALIYDADSMYMTSSGIIHLDASQNSQKTVFANKMINTGGMHIEYADSVKVITGI